MCRWSQLPYWYTIPGPRKNEQNCEQAMVEENETWRADEEEPQLRLHPAGWITFSTPARILREI